MIPGKTYKPEDFLRAAWRRRFMILAPVIVSAVAAGMYSYTQPNEFRSETTLLIVPPSGAGGLVAGTGVVPLEDRLYTIRQQLVSHSRLVEVVESEDLYREWRDAHPNGDVAERMRRDVTIEIVKGNPRRVDGTFFKIGYVSMDPETAARVTNRLADLFVQENTADRENAAKATNTFLDAQLAEARSKLEQSESQIEAYNQRYAQELPSTMPSQLDAIRRTETQLQNLEASLSADRAQRVALEGLIAAAEMPLPPGTASSSSRRPGDLAGASIGAQLDAARKDLKSLELYLTPEHPDVMRAKRGIQELEERARAEGVPQSADGGVLSPAEIDRRERVQQLRSQLAGLDRQIADKERSIPRLTANIATYQARVDSIPRREAELSALTRDHATLEAMYQKLLTSRETAGIATKLEAEQAERFRVIEPAKVPTSPFRPDRMQWALLGALFGLGLGVALTALIEVLDSSLRTDGDVAVALNLPVLAMIPVMHTAKELSTRRQLRAAASAMAVMVAVASVLALVW
jgi:polysaccharide chain length determinant protein (PEP-CTERM system associated)